MAVFTPVDSTVEPCDAFAVRAAIEQYADVGHYHDVCYRDHRSMLNPELFTDALRLIATLQAVGFIDCLVCAAQACTSTSVEPLTELLAALGTPQMFRDFWFTDLVQLADAIGTHRLGAEWWSTALGLLAEGGHRPSDIAEMLAAADL